MTPYQFVNDALFQDGSCNPRRLLHFWRIFPGDERDWLEYKASWKPREDHVERTMPDAKNDSYRWDVVKDLIALANSRGGVLLLGVDERRGPIGLSGDSGPSAGERIDAFIRRLKDSILPQKAEWQTCNSKGKRAITYSLDSDSFGLLRNRLDWRYSFSPEIGTVVAILIRGRRHREPLIWFAENYSEIATYARVSGQLGQKRRLVKSQLNADELRSLIAVNAEDNKEFDRWHRWFLDIEIDIGEYLENMKSGFNSAEYIQLELRKEISGRAAQAVSTASSEVLGSRGRTVRDLNAPKLAEAEFSENPFGRGVGLFIVGEAGSGKTTLLHKVFCDKAKSYSPGGIFPLLLSLESYAGQDWLVFCSLSSGIPFEEIGRRARNRGLFCLADSYDRCPDHYRDKLDTEIAKVLSDKSGIGIRLLMSGRERMHNTSINFNIAYINPLNPQQQRELFSRLDSLDASRIGSAIRRSGIPTELTGNPFFLKLLISAGLEARSNLRSRAEYLDTTVNVWLQRIAENVEKAKEILEEIAFKMLAGAENDLRPREDAVELVDERILKKTKAGRWRFGHDVLKEHFAAGYLLRHPSAIARIQRGSETTWGGVFCSCLQRSSAIHLRLRESIGILDPLLSAVMTDSTWAPHRDALSPSMDPWTSGLIRCFITQPIQETELLRRGGFGDPPRSLVARLQSPGLWTATSNQRRAELLSRLIALIDSYPDPWAEIATAVGDGAPEFRDLVAASANGWLSAACGFERPTHEQLRSWLDDPKMSIEAKAILVYGPFRSYFFAYQWFREYFRGGPWLRQPELISNRLWKQIIMLGVVAHKHGKSHIGPRTPLHLAKQPELIPKLVLKGILLPRGWVAKFLHQHIDALLDPDEVALLVRRRIIMADAIPLETRKFWAQLLSADQAWEHVSLSIMDAEDFETGVRQQWIQNGSHSKLRTLLAAGLLFEEELPEERIPKQYFLLAGKIGHPTASKRASDGSKSSRLSDRKKAAHA